MLDDVAGFLACPQCGAGLARAGSALRCRAGHSFDIARQGYVSLLPPGARAPAGDSAPMVAARSDFLAAGHYGGLAARLAAAARAALGAAGTAAGSGVPGGVPDIAAGAGAPVPAGVPGCVLDIGAGTGYYLAAVLDGLPGRAGLALDASKPALRRAARAHPRIGAVAADAWRRLPVADGAAAVVLDVFAPRQGAELARVLHPAGRLLVVTPNPGHLAELTGPLGLLSVDPRKEERLAATLGPGFALLGQDPYDAVLQLSHPEIAAVVGMGPSARHADPAVLAERMARLPQRVPVTLSVTLSVFGRKPPGQVRCR
jgi:23S rRNA (guanine745-N1)-methyltransferase